MLSIRTRVSVARSLTASRLLVDGGGVERAEHVAGRLGDERWRQFARVELRAVHRAKAQVTDQQRSGWVGGAVSRHPSLSTRTSNHDALRAGASGFLLKDGRQISLWPPAAHDRRRRRPCWHRPAADRGSSRAARQRTRRRPTPSPSWSAREQSVLEHLARGLSNAEIAAELRTPRSDDQKPRCPRAVQARAARPHTNGRVRVRVRPRAPTEAEAVTRRLRPVLGVRQPERGRRIDVSAKPDAFQRRQTLSVGIRAG
jgi:hypothetical protein